MKVAVFSTKPYDREFLEAANRDHRHELTFFEARLRPETAALAGGHRAVCAFVNDKLDREVMERLSGHGVEVVAMRSAGYNNVDVAAAADHGITVVRVPAYSPFAVAEHTVALLLALDRKLHRSYNRVREGNFSLDGLMGFDLHDRTVGIVGTGKIGYSVARILRGFGCDLLAYDLHPNDEVRSLGVRYVGLEELLTASDVVTLHCPLTPETRHLIDEASLEKMKDGVMLINTSRGGLVDTAAVIDALKTGKVGYLGLDVYEEEEELFFEDRSDVIIQDDTFSRLLTFPNVIITGHQAFFTRNALTQIARTTLDNLTACEQGRECQNVVAAPSR
jgi:D-lactate dehydrogenase